MTDSYSRKARLNRLFSVSQRMAGIKVLLRLFHAAQAPASTRLRRPARSAERRYGAVLLIGALTGMTLAASDPVSAQQQKRVDVLELFTSQGCSSCPPADALLRKLAERDDIIAISLPVSYWDHLGWKDTLAREAFNNRQYQYAKARGDRDVYTPQMVVNGLTHVVGSRHEAIESALAKTSRLLEPVTVPIKIRLQNDAVEIETGAAPAGSAYRMGQIFVVCYNSSVDVAIRRGENTGRSISYTNVVREWLPAGKWKGEPAHFKFRIPRGESFDAIAVLLQADDSRAMIGAAAIPYPSE